MKLLLFLALVAPQEGSWSVDPAQVTVGDSIRVTGSFRVAEGTSARIGPLEIGGDLELLDNPATRRLGERIEISFTVAYFAIGDQTIPTPQLEMVRADGNVDLVPESTVPVSVVSVLPDSDTTLAVKAGFDPIRRSIHRLEPLVYLELFVVFVSFLWWVARMRSPLPAVTPSLTVKSVEAPLAAWAAAGEVRAVGEVAHRRLQKFLAGLNDKITTTSTTAQTLAALEPQSGELPMRELAELLEQLDRVAFAPTHKGEVIQLADQVDEVIEELSRPETIETEGDEEK